jgi:hypothetical protein
MNHAYLKQTIAGAIGGIGSTQSTNTITIVGGFDSKLQITEKKMVVGSQSKYFVKSKIIEWEAFKDTYFNKGKLDSQYYPKLIDEVNTIIPFSTYVNKISDLVKIINEIYLADPKLIINGISKHLNLFSSIEMTIRHFFMTWKVYIEKQIELFCYLRNNYIEAKKLKGPLNNFDQLTAHWNKVDDRNNIRSSSIIILFNFPGKGMSIEKTVPKLQWGINGDPVGKEITAFLDLVKTKQFRYDGFCHYKPIERLLLLLKFPIHALCELNKKLDIDSRFNGIYISQNSDVNQIKCMRQKLEKLNCAKFKPDEFPNPPAKLKSFNNQNNNTEYFIEYIKKYIQMYKILLPCLTKKEELINDLSSSINLLANDVQNLIKKIKIPE